MFSQAKQRVVEVAKGDGNCAFNAFALGFCEPEVLNRLQLANNSFFVRRASQLFHLQPATWPILKNHLLTVSRADLQSTLSPLLREMAINSVINNRYEKAAHLDNTAMAIQVELDKYFQERRKKNSQRVSMSEIGDIFIRHPFIRKKFEELYVSRQGINAAQQALAQWWATTGHDDFLNRMIKPALHAGETDLYAGDLELAQLGSELGVNIHVKSGAGRNQMHTQIHRANGSMPVELVADGRSLTDRNIIYLDFSWKNLSLAELNARLSAVPEYDKVESYLMGLDALPTIGDVVPRNWGPACLAELKARGVINDRRQFVINITAEHLLDRLSELPSKPLVLQAWQNTYHIAPDVELENRGAAHWNNLKLVSAQPRPGLGQLGVSDGAPAVNKAKLPANTVRSTAKTTSALAAKQATAQPAVSNTAVKPKPTSYNAVDGEREVNNAVSEAFDLLQANRPPLNERQIKNKFNEVFNAFSSLLQDFESKRIDFGLFNQRKTQILDAVKQDIAQAVTNKRK